MREKLKGMAAAALYASHQAELQFLRCSAARDGSRPSSDPKSNSGTLAMLCA